MKYFLKKLLGHEILRSMIFWAIKFFLSKIVKSSGSHPYILHARSLNEVQLRNMMCQ